MSAEFSPLCGYSYAWRVGYKPQAFERLEKMLIIEKSDPDSAETHIFTDIDLIEQIIDSYGKLGFLFLSRDCIIEVNGKVPASHVLVHYYLYNFIYDCKAYLDSVAIMLNDFYSIGKRGGSIDLKLSSFRDEVIHKAPKLKKIIKKHENWFDTVASWRRDLIHRFSSPIGFELSYVPSREEMEEFIKKNQPCVMFVEPQPYFSANYPELNKKYGKAFRKIEPFCEEWIAKACEFYDQVCDVIAEALE